ncbi:type IV pilus twitching motility protein PilT [Spirillospora albida]|uniref:type IV pilus twitching motility protein PilT n=1 Tax=Spirillospora albida TaxID=58123 RepID=UPI0004BFC553|nr:type IV pilus twitching motility protein PilT [Spirillospora albida]
MQTAEQPGASELTRARASLDAMLVMLVGMHGSDLHLTAGAPPTARVHGDLRALHGYGELLAQHVAMFARSAAGEERWRRFLHDREMDFAYSVPGLSRFRVNLFTQRGSCGAVFRAVPHEIRSLDELDLPAEVGRLAALPRGLVLVTGPTGSGKTTTLAALVDRVNRTRAAHIVTVEDPVEYLHSHKRCLVNQREVGNDTESFATALRRALRQDPDIILIGELRDLETTATALTAAETGHLVLATLHTQSAAQTIDRIIDVFPSTHQQQIRTQLASTLQGVVTQALCPRADGAGRVVVTELMFATTAIRALIREGKTHQIPAFIQSGATDGMLAFDRHLADRVQRNLITFDRALEVCHSPEEFRRLAGKAALT